MKRRLAAIIAADLAGYSRLMRLDEEATMAAWWAYRREVIDPTVAEHGGRVVKLTGDGFLAEFASATDAVSAAIAMQTEINARVADVPADRRVQFRMGVNLGDILWDDEDIYGDGVNIAARIEALADPGGILVSASVFDQVRHRVAAGFEDLGERDLKNIDAPVRVFRLAARSETGAPAEEPYQAPALPDKPSIAVLPFENMSRDPDQEYFADGMAEDIITDLSQMPWFFVIARNSSFTYKGRAVDVKQVGRELGVAYVLEGSVRKAGPRLRINAQLVDAETGNHVWAERFDREITDIFEIQDEITRAITGAVAPQFLSAELKKTRRKDATQLNAWECVMRGRAHVWKLGRDDALLARSLFERAMTLAPDSGMGAGDLALVHFLDAFYGWSAHHGQSLKNMVHAAEQAVALDDGDPLALTILAWAYLFALKWDDALATVDRAIDLSPNFAPAIGIRGAILACDDQPEPAIATVNEAIRLSPHDGFMPYWLMGVYWAYHTLEDYERAAATARHAARISPKNPTFPRQLAAAYFMLDRPDDSQAALREYLDLAPDATLDDVRKIPSRNPRALERFVNTLRSVGIPEKP